MQSPSNQQACPIPCSLARDTQGLDNNRVILHILLSLKEEATHQHTHLLLVVVTHLHTPLSLVMEEHRELEAQGTLPTPHKQAEEGTLLILHKGEAILSPSRLQGRTVRQVLDDSRSLLHN